MKIKKYALHILILVVVLVSMAVPIVRVHADCPSGYIQTGTGEGGVSLCEQAPGGGSPGATSGVDGLVVQLQTKLNSILPLLLLIGVVYFVWGVVRYVIAGGEEAKTKGRDRMIYGIIGLAVIIGLWGLVNIVINTLKLSNSAPNVSNLVTQSSGSSTCQAISTSSNFPAALDYFTCIIGKSVIPFIFALAVLMFLWGAVKFFIINSDEEAKREQGKQFMIWGIIALAVMVSVWGLVNILGSTFGISGSVLPSVHP